MANRISYEKLEPFLKKNCVITSTYQEVLKNLKDNYKRFQKVSDQDLLALNSVFGENLEKALDLVETNKVTYFCTEKGFGIYQIEGSNYKTYTIFPFINYCPCPFYTYNVSGGCQLICKHVLAAVIADIINKKNVIEVTGEHLNDLLLESAYLKQMNEREDWKNKDSYTEQFLYPTPGVPQMFSPITHNWVQVPPQTMPWGLPPQSQPSIVRFTAGSFNTHPSSIKRKHSLDMDSPPAKMLVTEEKMAAHMRSLHISDIDIPDETANVGLKEEPMETERLPKIVVCDEIKNFKTESLIPETILKKLEKPEMALVLWQPPAIDLESKLREIKKLSLSKEKNEESEMNEEEEEEKKKIETDLAMETDSGSNENTFRPIDPVPIDPVPMPQVQNQYFQPVPQFQLNSQFTSIPEPFF